MADSSGLIFLPSAALGTREGFHRLLFKWDEALDLETGSLLPFLSIHVHSVCWPVLALDALASTAICSESSTVACVFPSWVRELWWNMKAHDKGKLPCVILWSYLLRYIYLSFSPIDRMGTLDVFLSLCYQFSQEEVFGRHEIKYLHMAWQIWLLLVEAAVHMFVVMGLEEWKAPASKHDSPGEWAN